MTCTLHSSTAIPRQRCILLCYLIGKAREKLKWADGKAVKAEIDMQVRYYKYVINIQVMYLK